jgi:hypothetical protein
MPTTVNPSREITTFLIYDSNIISFNLIGSPKFFCCMEIYSHIMVYELIN